MFLKKKAFKNKTIGELNNYTSHKPFSGSAGVAKFLIIVCCIFLVFFVGKYVIKGAQILGGYIGKSTVNIVSSTMGDDMIKDEFGNINVMIVGFGGQGQAGGYLADSIIVASFNPKLGAVTMLSVPRDLYVVNKENNNIGRINALFSHTVGRKLEFNSGAKALSEKLEEIMGIKTSYYALIDFEGFKTVIDTLGGITIDVPQTLHDVTYPNGKGGYMTVHFDTGVNLMDGERALQYARSRHSTSDFSRSLRQQLIVKGVMNKLMENGLSNVNKLNKLYEDYTNMVTTNISLKEMLGMVKYIDRIKHMFSFGYTNECSNVAFRFSRPACFLYTPSRELFGGASAILPDGGSPTNISFYDYTKNFGFFVAHNQEYLIENQKIEILNGIDKNFAKATVKKSEGFANQLAVKLKKYAFNITNVQNFSQTISGTTVYVLGTGEYQYTIKTLRNFITIDQIITTPDPLLLQQYTGADILLVMGNSYITQLVNKPFSYYK
ncbi:MAG TPA: LCP family protein [Candidatus Absconditabacterales bacterium]|nr:LCP family protein [Candidatus Absconditabacterales bacterium]